MLSVKNYGLARRHFEADDACSPLEAERAIGGRLSVPSARSLIAGSPKYGWKGVRPVMPTAWSKKDLGRRWRRTHLLVYLFRDSSFFLYSLFGAAAATLSIFRVTSSLTAECNIQKDIMWNANNNQSQLAGAPYPGQQFWTAGVQPFLGAGSNGGGGDALGGGGEIQLEAMGGDGDDGGVIFGQGGAMNAGVGVVVPVVAKNSGGVGSDVVAHEGGRGVEGAGGGQVEVQSGGGGDVEMNDGGDLAKWDFVIRAADGSLIEPPRQAPLAIWADNCYAWYQKCPHPERSRFSLEEWNQETTREYRVSNTTVPDGAGGNFMHDDFPQNLDLR